jgi:hypothetical protein
MKGTKFVVIMAFLVFLGTGGVSLAADLTGIWEVTAMGAGGENRTDTLLIVQQDDSFTYAGIPGKIRNDKYIIFGPLPQKSIEKGQWIQVDQNEFTAENDANFKGRTYISIYTEKDSPKRYMKTDINITGKKLVDPPPLIVLTGKPEIWVTSKAPYQDPGAKAFTEKGVDLTAQIVTKNTVDTNTAGEYTVTYSLPGDAGKPAKEIVRKVNVVDRAPPTLVLMGGEVVDTKKGAGYSDPVYVAYNYLKEEMGKKVTATINGAPGEPNSIDTSKSGKSYEIVFTAKDENGTTTAKRTVNVTTPEDEKSFFKYCFISSLFF